MVKYHVVLTTLDRSKHAANLKERPDIKNNPDNTRPSNYIIKTIKSLLDTSGMKDLIGGSFLRFTIFDSGSESLDYLKPILDEYPYLEVITHDTRLSLVENTNKALRYGAENSDYVVLVQDDVIFAKNAFHAMVDWVEQAPKDFSILSLWPCADKKSNNKYNNISAKNFWGNLFLIFKSSEVKGMLDWKDFRTTGTGHDMAIKDWAVAHNKKIYTNTDGWIQHIGGFSTLGSRNNRQSKLFIGENREAMVSKSATKTKVYIVITTYQHQKYAEKAIESLYEALKYCPPRYEFNVVLVDDCSTDREETLRVINRFRKTVRMAGHINPKNMGLTCLWNYGYQLAKDSHDYVLISNDDVLFSKGSIKELLFNMDEYYSFEAGGPITNAPGHSSTQNVRNFITDYTPSDDMKLINNISDQLKKELPKKEEKLNGFCLLFKTSFLKKNCIEQDKPFNEKFLIFGGEDEFFQRTKAKALNIPSSFVFHYKQVSVDRDNFKRQQFRGD